MFLFPTLTVTAIIHNPPLVRVLAHPIARSACCPACAQESTRVHSTYIRRPRDLPLSGQPVRLILTVRRFRCGTTSCRMVTFAERLPTLLPPAAQRTTRVTTALRAVSLTAGGEAGARLAQQIAMPSSPDTLLRIVRSTPLPPVSAPHVLGVDDWAFQKGRTYGTILIDGETHQALDLLPDRTAETLIAWLQTHPGSAIVTRDRAPAYAAAVTAAAPTAVQVADRWHLLKNLRDMLQRLFDRHRHDLAGTTLPLPPLSPRDREHRRDRGYEQCRAARLGHRAERWAAVQALHQQGHAMSAIARQLTMARQTVRRYVASSEPPPWARPSRRPSRIDPFVTILQAEWDAGHQETAVLFQAMRTAGYRGSTRAVDQWALLRRERQRGPAQHARRAEQVTASPSTTTRTPSVPAARTLAWILVKTGDRTPEETQWFQRMRTIPIIETCYQFALRFARMVREQTPDALGPWLQDAGASTIPELMTFAAGLTREEPSIAAALRLPFSNGPTEGQVTRLKQLRRAMDGRGAFDLVKRRFLLTQPASS